MIALLAAYVVVLQALLLPLSVAAGVPYASSICAAAAEGTHAPGSHETNCPCAAGCGMQCCVQALTGAPPLVTGQALAYARVDVPAPAMVAIARPAAKGPQIPRGPPAA